MTKGQLIALFGMILTIGVVVVGINRTSLNAATEQLAAPIAQVQDAHRDIARAVDVMQRHGTASGSEPLMAPSYREGGRRARQYKEAFACVRGDRAAGAEPAPETLSMPELGRERTRIVVGAKAIHRDTPFDIGEEVVPFRSQDRCFDREIESLSLPESRVTIRDLRSAQERLSCRETSL